jgi:hypothetical protein
MHFKYSFKPFKTLNLPEHVLIILPTKSPQSPNGSFMLFMKERLAQIRQEDVGLAVSMKEASSALITGWKKLDSGGRKTYDQASSEELKRYKLELELYKVHCAMNSLE